MIDQRVSPPHRSLLLIDYLSNRVYSVDKMGVEVPCNRHDEVLPTKFYEQLEKLSIERRKKAYVNYQLFLPTQLEVMKSKKTLQTAALTKTVHLLKRISLTRFDVRINSV